MIVFKKSSPSTMILRIGNITPIPKASRNVPITEIKKIVNNCFLSLVSININVFFYIL